jgi:hypothetical protein
MVQRGTFMNQWRHHRDFLFSQVRSELVFFKDRRIGPTSRPIEFGHDRRGVLDAYLVDPVFVAIEGQETTVAAKAKVIQCRDDVLRLQVCKS